MPPMAERSASLPMRPMPLMPTFIFIFLSGRYARRIANFVQARLESHAIERLERKTREYLKPPTNHGVKLVQQGGTLCCRTLELRRLGEGPGRGDEWGRKVRTELAMRRIAQCDDETHARCFRPVGLGPRLAPHAGHVVAQHPQ